MDRKKLEDAKKEVLDNRMTYHNRMNVHRSSHITKELIEEHTERYMRGLPMKQHYRSAIAPHYRTDNENPHLFGGEFLYLLKCHNLLDDETKKRFLEGTKRCELVDGVYSRWTKGYYFSLTQEQRYNREYFHDISKDEALGLTLTLDVCDDLPRLKRFVDRTIERHWTIYDTNLDDTLFKSVDSFKRMFPSYHVPSDRVSMKVAVGYTPNLIDLIWLLFAVVINSTKGYRVTSSRIMWFFKLKYLEDKGYDNILVKLAKKFYIYRSKKLYGEEYLQGLFNIYFKKDHPITILSEGIRLEE